MAQPYDSIGERYKSMKDLPAAAPERPSVLKVLGSVKGLNCCDLACGLGYWSQVLVEQGAVHVTAVDISEGMVNSAREAASNLPEQVSSKIDFHVADCGKPSQLPGGHFDVILGVWFLNYASCYEEMLGMWRNIALNLKPGGRFVALTSNTYLRLEPGFDSRYGTEAIPLSETKEGGWKCRIIGHTSPDPVMFENYHYPHEFYERAAAEAGMKDLTWRSHTLPDDRRPEGYWDVYCLRPHFSLCTAIKP